MPEERLLAAMEEETAGRIAELDRQAAETIATLQSETERLLAQSEQEEEARAENRFREYARQQRVRLENQRRTRIGNLQFEIAEEVFRDLEEAVAAVRHRDDYPHIWARLFDEAFQVYREDRDDRPRLRVAPDDCAVAQSRREQVVRIESDPAVDAGVELVSPDGRLRVRNTLRSRLQKGRDEFLKMISEALKEHVVL